jgi:hypothetical protein
MCASRLRRLPAAIGGGLIAGVEPVWRWGRVKAGVEAFHDAVHATASSVPCECLDRAAGA